MPGYSEENRLCHQAKTNVKVEANDLIVQPCISILDQLLDIIPPGFAGRRLLDYAVLPRGAPPAGARSQRLQAVGLALAVRHPPRPHHHDHAGRLLGNILLLVRLTLSGNPIYKVTLVVTYLGSVPSSTWADGKMAEWAG